LDKKGKENGQLLGFLSKKHEFRAKIQIFRANSETRRKTKGVEHMDSVIIKIGGREIPLRFRMNQFIQAEQEVGNLGEIKENILNGKDRGQNLVKMIRIIGNAGLKHAGEEDNLTDE
jgi:hypothetical protein